MGTQQLAMLDGASLPVCPDCKRSVWQVIREKIGANGNREVEVRCSECGTVQTMVRQGSQPNWTAMSHRA